MATTCITANPQDLRNSSYVEAVIPKPFDLHDVLFEIETVLRRAASNQ
jgi:hypothetical protein